MKTFVAALWRTYQAAWRFLFALPVIAIAVVSVEAIQHIVEWRSGFYVSFAAMGAEGADPSRLLAGMLKVTWLLVLSYWTARFLVSGSASRSLAADPVALRKYGLVTAFGVVGLAIMLIGPTLLPAGLRRGGSIAVLLFNLATMPIGIALAPWMVGSALGDRHATVPMSFRNAKGSIPWGIALSLLAPLPFMIVHYALGYGAVGRPPLLAVSMLGGDALLTAYLGVVANMAFAVVADHMADRAGTPLELGV